MIECFLGETYLSWLPAVTPRGWLAIGLVVCTLWLVLRLGFGKSRVRASAGLMAIRAVSLTVMVLILLGPTIVDEHAGAVMRPTMMYLYDGSQSMQLGETTTRWDESLKFTAEAQRAAGASHSGDVQSFRFGHRLEPLVQPATGSSDAASASSRTEPATAMEISPPDASDSRLGDAMRQLLPQINSRQTAGVVLLSDGRVRASESVERLAEFFGKSKVPLHVVPVGHEEGSGDIAVVSLVVPSRVRKYTENELQVFLRSFGFTGQRTTVRVVSRNKISDTESATLASVPITLSGGAQSASLTFRVNEHPEDLVVIVDPLEGELAARNNGVETRVEIDRTKVRVLCVESDPGAATQAGFLSQVLSLGASTAGASTGLTTMQAALQADEDVECSMMISSGGGPPRGFNPSDPYGKAAGFPTTRAELFAFDCVILSNVGPDVIDEEQALWLAQWVEGRGGGLIVCGSGSLSPGDWADSPLSPMLPIAIDDASPSFPLPTPVDIAMPDHPVWRLRLEKRLNDQLINQLPTLTASGSNYPVKSTADVLATKREDGSVVMAAHRVGRGRVLVSTAALGGQAFSDLANQWGSQPEQVAAKFLRNLVYWATEGSSTGRRRLIAESDKRFYRPGEPLSVFATAYDEAARRTNKYRVWAMFEPSSLDDMSLYSPLMWPDNVVRESGEVSPRLAWGEELMLGRDSSGDGYEMKLILSESGGVGDSGLRIEMTAYEGAETSSSFDHGTQVDSTSLAIQILSDPFEQQNPLPNHELLARLAAVSGGEVLEQPSELAELLRSRDETLGPPHRDLSPAWNKWWLWLGLIGLLTGEWIWRKATGLA